MLRLSYILSLLRLLKATKYALSGLRGAFCAEAAFQLEVLLSLILLPLACYLGQTPMERVVLIGAWLLVLVVELLNTAVETVVNRIGADQHPLSGRAKDLAAAAVFVAVINAVVVWGMLII